VCVCGKEREREREREREKERENVCVHVCVHVCAHTRACEYVRSSVHVCIVHVCVCYMSLKIDHFHMPRIDLFLGFT